MKLSTSTPIIGPQGMIGNGETHEAILTTDECQWLGSESISVAVQIAVEDMIGNSTALSLVSRYSNSKEFAISVCPDEKNPSIPVVSVTFSSNGKETKIPLFRKDWRLVYVPEQKLSLKDICLYQNKLYALLGHEDNNNFSKVVCLEADTNRLINYKDFNMAYESICVYEDRLMLLSDKKRIEFFDTTEFKIVKEVNVEWINRPVGIATDGQKIFVVEYKGSGPTNVHILDQDGYTKENAVMKQLNIARAKSCSFSDEKLYVAHNGRKFDGNVTSVDINSFATTSFHAPSAYVCGIGTYGDKVLCCTEGFSKVGDMRFWDSVWEMNDPAFNDICFSINRRSHSIKLWINDHHISTQNIDPKFDIDVLSLGSGNGKEFFSGYIKNLRLQNKPLDAHPMPSPKDGTGVAASRIDKIDHSSWKMKTGNIREDSGAVTTDKPIAIAQYIVKDIPTSAGWLLLEWEQKDDPSSSGGHMGINQRGTTDNIVNSKTISNKSGRWVKRTLTENIDPDSNTLLLLMNIHRGTEIRNIRLYEVTYAPDN